MNEPTFWIWILLVCHFAVCAGLLIYGVHRYTLVYLYYKYRRNTPRKTACFLQRPSVTIQLPMFNEQYVARRVIEAACQLAYPKDRLHIQVLDDSTDDTTEIARETCDRMRAAGCNVELLHRDNRSGFKAGALAEGLKKTASELIFIFDADFIPPKDILNELVDYFAEPKVGMVQARWEHLNREQSWLTKTQAILLDGHFVIEHAARNRSGRFMSFNGTAGAWRRTCIEDAGGWHHDTLTEDLDLSYRAQLKGWRFVYLPDITSPAELPPEMNAFKSQQHRWAKGGAQTCRKLLGGILRSRLPWRIKTEAFFHLTSWVSYFMIVLLTLMLFPVLYGKVHWFSENWVLHLLVDMSMVLLATFSASSFYVASQREIFRTWSESVKYLPFLMSLGVGISLNNARAALEGFFGKSSSEFVRTPKFGVEGSSCRKWQGRVGQSNRLDAKRIQAWCELLMAIYMSFCVYYTITNKMWIGLFFMLLFMVGYFYVALLTFHGQYQAARQTAGPQAEQDPLPATLTAQPKPD